MAGFSYAQQYALDFARAVRSVVRTPALCKPNSHLARVYFPPYFCYAKNFLTTPTLRLRVVRNRLKNRPEPGGSWEEKE